MRDKILLTGASGFIGQYFVSVSSDWNIMPVSLINTKPDTIDFSNIKAVIHLAGIAHRMNEPNGEIYYQVNEHLAAACALAARTAGVQQFVYVSTIKVYGVESTENSPLTEASPCVPVDDYGKSKLAGEQAVQALATDDFIVSIVRPPLVYGPGVKGNMAQLLRLVKRGWPLPFADIRNRRSMVYVGNLVALLHVIVAKRAGGIFLAADRDGAVSTTELIENLGRGLSHPISLFSFPLPGLLRRLKPGLFSRLFDSLEIDDRHTRQILAYMPPFTFTQGIEAMITANEMSC